MATFFDHNYDTYAQIHDDGPKAEDAGWSHWRAFLRPLAIPVVARFTDAYVNLETFMRYLLPCLSLTLLLIACGDQGDTGNSTASATSNGDNTSNGDTSNGDTSNGAATTSNSTSNTSSNADCTAEPCLIATGYWGHINGITVDQDFIYFESGSIFRLPKGVDISPEQITFSVPTGGVYGMAQDDERLYWATQDAYVVYTFDKSGDTEPRGLVEQPGRALSRAIIVEDDTIYWNGITASGAVGFVGSAKLDGSEAVVLHQPEGDTYAIAVDDTHIYVPSKEYILRMNKDGSEVTNFVTLPGSYSTHVMDDEEAIYFADQGNGTVLRASKADATLTTIATGQSNPSVHVVTSEYVCWTTYQASPRRNSFAIAPKDGGGELREVGVNSTLYNAFALDGNDLYIGDDNGDIYKYTFP